jgi:hypothetical protein
MPWLLVAEARAETAIDAIDDWLGFTALVDLARFATRAATPSEVGVGVESAPAALLVIAWRVYQLKCVQHSLGWTYRAKVAGSANLLTSP